MCTNGVFEKKLIFCSCCAIVMLRTGLDIVFIIFISCNPTLFHCIPDSFRTMHTWLVSGQLQQYEDGHCRLYFVCKCVGLFWFIAFQCDSLLRQFICVAVDTRGKWLEKSVFEWKITFNISCLWSGNYLLKQHKRQIRQMSKWENKKGADWMYRDGIINTVF